MEFKDYYKTLGVAKAASADEIKKAYRKLARKHHPDISKVPDATERMVALNEANAVLSDPERRAAYDALGQVPPTQDARGYSPPPGWDAGFSFSDVGANAGPDAGEHSDFFEQLFGRTAQARRANHGARPEAQPAMRGSDHHVHIDLDLLDAYEGANRTIVLRDTQRDDAGRVSPEPRHLQVRIPKGVHEGQHIRLAGRGGPGYGGAPAGDLLLEVRFLPDPRWRAEGRDVYQHLSLAPWEAMLGTRLMLHTLGGDKELTVPAGWKSGRQLRLKGLGIPGSGKHAAGHLYIELALALPAADSDASRAAYLAMAKAFPAFGHVALKESDHVTS